LTERRVRQLRSGSYWKNFQRLQENGLGLDCSDLLFKPPDAEYMRDQPCGNGLLFCRVGLDQSPQFFNPILNVIAGLFQLVYQADQLSIFGCQSA